MAQRRDRNHGRTVTENRPNSVRSALTSRVESIHCVWASPAHRVRSVVVNGASLAYHERGQGQSVVFVHGGYSDLRTWRPQLEAFAASYRAVTYSRRCARPNEAIAEGQDDQMLPHVDDLLGLLQCLNLASADLVGNSWGAFICTLAALKDPGLMRTLVLGEPPVLPLFMSNSPTAGELVRLFLRGPRDALQRVA